MVPFDNVAESVDLEWLRSVAVPLNPATPQDRDQVSYLTLRRVVGFLGVALPVVLALWGWALDGCCGIRDSISDYYAARTRDALVGILFTIAWFLFTYRGYDDTDKTAGNFACFFALGVALSPNSGSTAERAIHYTSAALLFLVLAWFSLVQFTKSGATVTLQKLARNRVYRACGWTMLACIALIPVYSFFLADTALRDYKPVFWLEAILLWAFGLSWFVKGETLWRDRAP